TGYGEPWSVLDFICIVLLLPEARGRSARFQPLRRAARLSAQTRNGSARIGVWRLETRISRGFFVRGALRAKRRKGAIRKLRSIPVAVEIRILGRGDEMLLSTAAAGVFDHPVEARRCAEFLNDPRHHIAAAVDGGRVVGFASAVHYVHPDKP